MLAQVGLLLKALAVLMDVGMGVLERIDQAVMEAQEVRQVGEAVEEDKVQVMGRMSVVLVVEEKYESGHGRS